MVMAIAGVFAVVLAVLLIAIIPNLNKNSKKNNSDASGTASYYGSEGSLAGNSSGSSGSAGQGSSESGSTGSGSSESPVLGDSAETGESGLHPSDLDFWDLYPSDTDENGNGEGGTNEGENSAGGNAQNGNGQSENSQSGNTQTGNGADGETEEDESTDGKHTSVTLRDGSTEWVTISQYLPKNDYDYTGLVCKNDQMEYYENGVKLSFLGIDVDKYQEYIDFNKVRKAGIDFVMIRVGARGYGTGQISIDDYYYDNIKRATDAGLEVGVYFSSQAITKDEALEEATTVLNALNGYNISYPVVFDMGFVANDTARIETLSKDEKTVIAKTFLDTISSNGFTAMIYGDKEWLIKEIDMSKLTAYDVWLSEIADLPDYPYKFTIWQYKNNATVDGISGYVSLDISFIDYSEK